MILFLIERIVLLMKITSNEKIDRVFLIKSVEVKATKIGNNYLDLRLTDKDNDIRAKKWGYNGDKPPFEELTLQRIIGTTSDYNGQVQLNVAQILPVDTSMLDLADYVPCTPLDCDEALLEIYNVICMFENDELERLTETALNQVEKEFLYYPAALSMHDACVGGLCHHTYCMMQTALAICEVYPFINRDLLLTGVILHDLAKINEIDACELYPRAHTRSAEICSGILLWVQLTLTSCAISLRYRMKCALRFCICLSHITESLSTEAQSSRASLRLWFSI